MPAMNNLKTYRRRVRAEHSTRLVRAGFSLYAWFWFHTEFWLPPLGRRPYTFILRDWIYGHRLAFAVLVTVWYGGLLILAGRQARLALVLGILSSLLLAHLVWGSRWRRGEQEWPPYLG